MTPELLTVQVS